MIINKAVLLILDKFQGYKEDLRHDSDMYVGVAYDKL